MAASMMKHTPRILAAGVFATAAALYMLVLAWRGGAPPGGVPVLMAVTMLPAAVAGFFLGARLQREASSVSSTRTRALRGLFAGLVLTALAYTLGILGFVAVDVAAHGPYAVEAFVEAFEAAQEILKDGVVELLLGLPFGALAGTIFYAIAGK